MVYSYNYVGAKASYDQKTDSIVCIRSDTPSKSKFQVHLHSTTSDETIAKGYYNTLDPITEFVGITDSQLNKYGRTALEEFFEKHGLLFAEIEKEEYIYRAVEKPPQNTLNYFDGMDLSDDSDAEFFPEDEDFSDLDIGIRWNATSIQRYPRCFLIDLATKIRYLVKLLTYRNSGKNRKELLENLIGLLCFRVNSNEYYTSDNIKAIDLSDAEWNVKRCDFPEYSDIAHILDLSYDISHKYSPFFYYCNDDSWKVPLGKDEFEQTLNRLEYEVNNMEDYYSSSCDDCYNSKPHLAALDPDSSLYRIAKKMISLYKEMTSFNEDKNNEVISQEKAIGDVDFYVGKDEFDQTSHGSEYEDSCSGENYSTTSSYDEWHDYTSSEPNIGDYILNREQCEIAKLLIRIHKEISPFYVNENNEVIFKEDTIRDVVSYRKQELNNEIYKCVDSILNKEIGHILSNDAVHFEYRGGDIALSCGDLIHNMYLAIASTDYQTYGYYECISSNCKNYRLRPHVMEEKIRNKIKNDKGKYPKEAYCCTRCRGRAQYRKTSMNPNKNKNKDPYKNRRG